MNKQPIGIFDSGVGGTSIWKEIYTLLPNENTIYLADSANAPYGIKSKEAILQLSIKNTEYLLNKGCKIIVVACNTATTNAITQLRVKFNVPFIGIEPAIKPAALNSKTKAIGILATKGTLSSELFHKTTNLYAQGHVVIEQIGTGLVELIEAGKATNKETRNLLKLYLKPMLNANIDYLVLGCTHYPYLIPLLLELLPNHVKIIDSGLAVAKQTKAILEKHDLLNSQNSTSKNIFYSNVNPKVMTSLLGNKFNVEFLNF
ncbi:glutamate racemase [Pseudalgibacter alginicilyticus]|uniref:Glutamate racemase n=1 Tax=Pseudalgibacter alginicilyticus TaxID=1736674 RepID=A0A0N7HYR8_9FLAO|nr:glutamate racemase [Pseudalgibacter alginicilyticus]ALJ06014.1 glutamate racemase [Pseudalgibacter alginicilyticus]